MSGPSLFDDWLPWRLLPTVPVTPAAMLQTAVRTAGDRMLGRRLTVRAGEADVEMTLAELDFRVSSVGLGQAQMGDVRLVFEDIAVPDTPLDRLVLVCRDVEVRSLPSPVLVAASVEVAVTVSAEVLADRIAEVRPDVLVEVGTDRIVRVRSARRPHWGALHVEPDVGADGVSLRPVAVQFGGVRIRLPRRLRPISVTVPDLPRGLRLTGVEPGEGELVVYGLADRWRERLSSIPLGTLVGWLTTAATTLTVPRLGGPR
ncbi:hypothetical protein [Amycolatopsis anabasis]|uniref:hypothetical protein n=1 Tax=Amycolatopsis anabasis TaxID=1840409 RepID=UPI00131E7D4A|nr:hypothetical protein [Amycolatopsis anabasis]